MAEKQTVSIRLQRLNDGWVVFDPQDPSVKTECLARVRSMEQAIRRVMARKRPD
ncbi:MAG: hypothetical protein K2Q10_07575 [Rhodospirillales bacterium]|nr:hypothetical protein [Rhodospirillales bacterium]